MNIQKYPALPAQALSGNASPALPTLRLIVLLRDSRCCPTPHH